MDTILIVTLHADPSMPPGVGEWGGTHTYMRELLMTLSNKDLELVLITRRVYPHQDIEENIDKNCKIIRIDLGHWGSFDKKNLYDLHEVSKEKVHNIIASLPNKPKLIHSVYWNSGHLAMDIAKDLNINYVHSVISNAKGRNSKGAKGTHTKREYIEKQIFSNASKIICVAESEKQEIHKFYDINLEKIIVAGQYVHDSFQAPAHNNYGKARMRTQTNKKIDKYLDQNNKTVTSISSWWNIKSFIYVGRISLDKGVDIIISSWVSLYKEYKEKCPPLWLVGGSPEEIDLMRTHLIDKGLIEIYDCEDSHKLTWWGYLDEEGISSLYLQCSVLITHSRYEPGGRVAIEAMSSGLPVLATPNGFALDSIKDWHNGFLIPYNDNEELTERMRLFVLQPYLSNTLGRAAKDSAVNIINSWSFENAHKTTYIEAISMKTTIKRFPKMLQSRNYFEKGLISTYPHVIKKPNIEQIRYHIENCLKVNVSSIKEITWDNDISSYQWIVKTNNGDYYIKSPYDRLKRDSFNKDYSKSELIDLGHNLYLTELDSVLNKGVLPIISYDNDMRLIVKQNGLSIKAENETEIFGKTVDSFLELYKTNVDDLQMIFESINVMINSKIDYKDIIKYYKSKISLLPTNYHLNGEFSIRLEIKRLVSILHSRRFKLTEFQFENIYECLNCLESNQNCESLGKVVISYGHLNLESFEMHNDKVFYNNTECVHPAWFGRDLADYLIKYSNTYLINENFESWQSLFNTLPIDTISKNLIASWIIVITCQEIISSATKLLPIHQKEIDRLTIITDYIN